MRPSPTTSRPKSRAQRLRIPNILVPVDFSKMSIHAIETAKLLARRFGSAVHLANVYESSYPAGFLESESPFVFAPLSYLEGTREAAQKRLQDLAKKHGLTGTCEAEVGSSAFDEICRIARKLQADLIVTPTHGRGAVKHLLLGSTAERLVQHSPCPVFVTRKRKPLPRAKSVAPDSARLDTILVPVDFSHSSLDGLKYAIQFAGKVGAKILVLSVLHFGYPYTADGYAMYDLSPLQDAARAAAEREIRRFVRRVRFGRVKFETAIEIGSPVDQICAFAAERKADLIITPTHGYTGLKHVLIGSTAEHVTRRATCPVLVVPSHPGLRVQLARQTEVRMLKSQSAVRPALRQGSILEGRSKQSNSGRFPYRLGKRGKYRGDAF